MTTEKTPAPGTKVQRVPDGRYLQRHFGTLGTIVDIDEDEERSLLVTWDNGETQWVEPSRVNVL